MSETKVQILLDVGQLETDDLSPEGVVKAIKDIDKIREERNQALLAASGYLKAISDFSKEIIGIVDGDFDMMQKANFLRSLANKGRQYVKDNTSD